MRKAARFLGRRSGCQSVYQHESNARALEQARIHPRQIQPDRVLLAGLDAGEAAVIMAALQLGVSTVLLDKRKARRVAARVDGLQVKGRQVCWWRQ